MSKFIKLLKTLVNNLYHHTRHKHGFLYFDRKLTSQGVRNEIQKKRPHVGYIVCQR